MVSQAEWQSARDHLLAKEKAHTRASDILAAERRRLSMVEITKRHVSDGEGGKSSLLDLFEGRRQLVQYHFMFAPNVGGWPFSGCEGCSWYADNVGNLTHLQARDTVEPIDDKPPGQRDQHIAAISRDGRMKWQATTGYGKRALVETAIGRYKAIIGRRLRARSFHAQQTEVAIGCTVLNKMLECACPKSVRRNGVTA